MAPDRNEEVGKIMNEKEFDRHFASLADYGLTDSLPQWEEVALRMEKTRLRRRRRWILAALSSAAAVIFMFAGLGLVWNGDADYVVPPHSDLYVTVTDIPPYVCDDMVFTYDELYALPLSSHVADVPDEPSSASVTGSSESGAGDEAVRYRSTDIHDDIRLVPDDGVYFADASVTRRKIKLAFGTQTESSPFDLLFNTPVKDKYLMQQNSHLISPDLNKRDTVIEKKSKSFSVPVSLGVGLRIPLGKIVDFGVGVNYTVMTRRLSGEFNGEFYTDISNTQQYIGVPVNVFFNILHDRRFNFYVQTGAVIERGISNVYTMNSASGTDIRHREPIYGFQFSVLAGMGFEYMLADFVGIYVDPSLRYYFDNKQARSIRTDQQLQCCFEMGVRVRL